jgi:hypothetical protein
MSVFDDLLQRGEKIGAAADRLGAAAEVASLWVLAARAQGNGELEERLSYYFDIARAARAHIPSKAGALWHPERDLIAALSRAYCICASDKEHVPWLPRMDDASGLLLELASVLETTSDAGDWLDRLTDEEAYWAQHLFEHVLRAHRAKWTTLTPDSHRRFAELNQRLFDRVLARDAP